MNRRLGIIAIAAALSLPMACSSPSDGAGDDRDSTTQPLDAGDADAGVGSDVDAVEDAAPADTDSGEADIAQDADADAQDADADAQDADADAQDADGDAQDADGDAQDTDDATPDDADDAGEAGPDAGADVAVDAETGDADTSDARDSSDVDAEQDTSVEPDADDAAPDVTDADADVTDADADDTDTADAGTDGDITDADASDAGADADDVDVHSDATDTDASDADASDADATDTDATDADASDDSGDTTPTDADDADTGGEPPIVLPPQRLPIVDLRFRAVETSRMPGVQYSPSESAADTVCGEAVLLTGGAAIEDYDGDGLLDVFLPRLDGPDRLFRNLGGMRFVDVADELGVDGLDDGGTSNGAVWADVDGDGELELYVTRLYGPNRLYDRQRDGTFVDVAPAFSLDRADDIDEDGCQRTFGVTFTDLDRDGDLDALLARWGSRAEGGATKILLQTPEGFRVASPANGFVTPTRSVIFGLPVFEFSGDTADDVYVVADFGRSQVFERRGSEFAEITDTSGAASEENGMGHALADIDGDGDLDLFVTAISGGPGVNCMLTWGCTGNRMFLNRGDGTFRDATDEFGVREGGWGWGAAFADLDNDGDNDLSMTNGYEIPWSDPSLELFVSAARPYNTDRNRLWRNDGVLPLTDVSEAAGFDDTGNGRAVIPFDADRDGDLDLLVTRNMGEVALYENTSLDRYRGTTVRITGLADVYRGLDGRLEVKPTREGEATTSWLEPYTVFASSSPHEFHVGLGDHEGELAEVQLVLRDGRRFIWDNVRAGAHVVLDTADAR